MKTAIIILGHGSLCKGADTAAKRIAAEIEKIGKYEIVQHAFLRYTGPTADEALERCIQQNVEKIVIVPFFLQSGTHVAKDIPDFVVKATKLYPSIAFDVTEFIGTHLMLKEIVLDLINEKAS
ncbi:MAG TPA: CbiX/SirB N-terminal domain-containing protein [Nitrospirota bacterium]|nr:CbiX/SirB N-terminal domain-containing protein [Nitrospirota bacterium]